MGDVASRRATRTTGSTPTTGGSIAQAIQAQLVAARAARDAAYFDQRYADFDKRARRGARSAGTTAMAPYKGSKVVTYHRSWPNFADRFGLDVDRLRRAASRAFRRRRSTRSIS